MDNLTSLPVGLSQFNLKSLASCSSDLRRLLATRKTARPCVPGITSTLNALWTMEAHEYLKQGNGQG